jgi:phage tail-like protein
VTYVRKLPGELKWDNIRCRRGVTTTMALWDWRKQVEQGKIDDARRNGSIVLYSPQDEEVARWNFTAGWPCKMSGPEFNANTNEMAIEEVEIAHEGLERVK